ncbi:MAG TPA: class II fructose-bisphosphate aldolase [Tepidisphaeraceae bacterium]|jgi:ketose-bisphosphate aldolase|nr:class II fructose-bisphosphate aldolase [Tepidisphaeraceae bacterium]
MPLSDSASLVRHAHKNKYCVVQINTNGGTYDITRAIIESAEELNCPVILGCYEANLKYRGYEYAAMQMRFFAEHAKVPVAIHLDHGSTVDACQKAINAGFTSVMIDGSHLPIAENLEQTKAVVAISKQKKISVEGEIGQLQKLNPDGSMPEVKNLSDPAEAAQMSKTGIDMLAVGIGNAHGFYKEAPDIRFDLLEKLAAASTVPLVLHGSTGLSDEVVKKCVAMGMAKANLGTLIRTRCVEFTQQVIAENKHLNHPWRVGQSVKDLLKPDIKHMLQITGGAGRAKDLV